MPATHGVAVDLGADAVAGDGLEPARRRQLEAALAGGGDDRRRQRMLAAALGGRDEAQQIVVVEAGTGLGSVPCPAPNSTTSVTRGLPSVIVPGLVEDDDVELVRRLERGAVADEDAVLGALAGADHDRRRRRESQCARARDDEHGDEVEQRVVERRRRAEAPARRRT